MSTPAVGSSPSLNTSPNPSPPFFSKQGIMGMGRTVKNFFLSIPSRCLNTIKRVKVYASTFFASKKTIAPAPSPAIKPTAPVGTLQPVPKPTAPTPGPIPKVEPHTPTPINQPHNQPTRTPLESPKSETKEFPFDRVVELLAKLTAENFEETDKLLQPYFANPGFDSKDPEIIMKQERFDEIAKQYLIKKSLLTPQETPASQTLASNKSNAKETKLSEKDVEKMIEEMTAENMATVEPKLNAHFILCGFDPSRFTLTMSEDDQIRMAKFLNKQASITADLRRKEQAGMKVWVSDTTVPLVAGTLVKVPDDGNCLLHAAGLALEILALQLKDQPGINENLKEAANGLKHDKLRKQITDYLESDWKKNSRTPARLMWYGPMIEEMTDYYMEINTSAREQIKNLEAIIPLQDNGPEKDEAAKQLADIKRQAADAEKKSAEIIEKTTKQEYVDPTDYINLLKGNKFHTSLIGAKVISILYGVPVAIYARSTIEKGNKALIKPNVHYNSESRLPCVRLAEGAKHYDLYYV